MDRLSFRKESEFQNWYSKISGILPTPETIILKLNDDVKKILWTAFDGEAAPADLDLSLYYDALDCIGYPAFIRTENGSGKHQYDQCCFLGKKEDLYGHMVSLLEWSETVDLFGLSFNFLVIRKFLPPISEFKAFLGMPVAKEYRVFIRDGKYVCKHFYWPEEAIEVFGNYNLPDNWKDLLVATSLIQESDHETLQEYAETFGAYNPGNLRVSFRSQIMKPCKNMLKPLVHIILATGP
jgi:hypothetical protein